MMFQWRLETKILNFHDNINIMNAEETRIIFFNLHMNKNVQAR